MHPLTRDLIRPAYLLERRLENALVEAEDHIGIFEEFTTDLNEDHADEVARWRRSVLEWEDGDMNGSSPYDLDGEGEISLFTNDDDKLNVPLGL